MRKIELFEDERATGYNQFVETWIPNYSYFLDQTPKILREIVNKELLVVGCGTGNEIERFVQSPEHWTVTGIDPSPDMIKQARSKFQGNDDITLIEGLVSDVKADKKYGAATLLLVLHFLEDKGDKLSLLKDISERMTSGGTLVMLDITGSKSQIKQNLKILQLLLPDGLEEKEVADRLERIENKLFPVSEERLSELCTLAGFDKAHRFFQSSFYMGWLIKKK
jgi:tRNA (cmo5U34)-methyltransferase